MDNYEIDATRQPVVTVKDGKVFATSRDVAESFGKRHDNVIRDIENLCLQEPKLRLLSFEETVVERPNPSGGAPIESRAFIIDRDGFTLLAMGFAGQRALKWKLRYIEAFNAMEAELRIGAAGPDILADYSTRVHSELAEYRDFVGKEVGGIRGAVLHYVKEYVVSPLTGLRQYLDDRFSAIRERDKMILGAIGDQRQVLLRADAGLSTVLVLARRSLDPEAFIRPEWCDVDDIYRLAGVDKPIPRRGTLSATVSRSLDAYCKVSLHQTDMRSWKQGGKPANYWRASTVKLWLKADGLRMIRLHIDRNTPPVQGVIPFGPTRAAK